MGCRGWWGSRGWWRPRVGGYRVGGGPRGEDWDGNSPEVGIGVIGGHRLAGMGM